MTGISKSLSMDIAVAGAESPQIETAAESGTAPTFGEVEAVENPEIRVP